MSWQASPSPLTMAPSQAHICCNYRHKFLSTARGVEAQRPRSDRSQMQHPGIPGKERWRGGPPSQGLQVIPSTGWVCERVRPQAQVGQRWTEIWAPGILISGPRGYSSAMRALEACPQPAYSCLDFCSGTLCSSSREICP